jgi:hypothetical protein
VATAAASASGTKSAPEWIPRNGPRAGGKPRVGRSPEGIR